MDRGSSHEPDAVGEPGPASGAVRRADLEELICRSLDLVDHLQPQEYTEQHEGRKRELDAAMLRDAARARGISTLTLSADTSLFGPAASGTVMHKNMPSTLLGLDRSVTNNKHLTKRVLAARGLPVARGRMVSSFSEALTVFAAMGPPVVTKPLFGSGGRGVTVGITTETELEAACAEIVAMERKIVMEEMVTAVDLRIMTIRGRSVAATLRVPANVTGDGQGTIRELIAAKNEIRSTNAYLRHSPIDVISAIEARLGARGLTLDSVPRLGERVFLRLTANISSGGDSYTITELVHPDLLDLAERAAACFPSATHAGMDILAERIDVGLDTQRAIVCEVNLNNEIPMHILPMYGPPTSVHEMLMDPIAERLDAPDGAGRGVPPAPVDVPALTAMATAASPADPEQPDRPDEQDPTGRAHGREVDNEHLRAEFLAAGYCEVDYRGALIFCTRGSQDVVIHRSGRSVVSDALASRPEALAALAGAAGVPALAPLAGSELSGHVCQLLFINDEVVAALLTVNGTDAVGLPGCPWPELLTYTAALTGPIGPTPILSISFGLQEQDGTDGPTWALRAIDPNPVLAHYAFPASGVAAEVYSAAARALINGPSYLLPGEESEPPH